jgi:hypothetical protein
MFAESAASSCECSIASCDLDKAGIYDFFEHSQRGIDRSVYKFRERKAMMLRDFIQIVLMRHDAREKEQESEV